MNKRKFKPPHAVQLSRLRAPTIRRGRPYTVDFGIAKPLYKQVLSKLSSGAHPRWILITANKTRITAGLVALYTSAFLPFTSNQKIVYADPITTYYKYPPVAQLTIPVITPVELAEALPVPITQPSPVYSFANLYAPLNCTWYVASRLPIPNDWGNANTWGTVAASEGYTVSDIPKVGAVAWNTNDSYLGHVALVEAVNGDVVTVSEMNYQGLGVIDNRVANPGEFRYIYL